MSLHHAFWLLLIIYVCSGRKAKHEGGLRHLHPRSTDVHKHCGNEFPCLNSTQCVPQEKICDGTPDCDNGSDEWELEECRDKNVEDIWDGIFGTKNEDSEEEDEDDDNEMDIRTEVPCVKGTYPASCDCFIEMEGTSTEDLPSMIASLNTTAYATTGSASDDAYPAADSNASAALGSVSGSSVGGLVVGVRLDCSARGLTSFPRGFPDNTISIDVSDNKITKLMKQDFEDLSQLRQLLLSRNRLQSIEEGVFNMLTNLETLRLIACGFQNLPPEIFSALRNLKTLDLSYNKLSSLTKNSLSGLHNLEYLDIRGNQLSELEAGVFEDTPDIYFIHMSQNNLPSVSSSLLRPLRQLRLLNVHRNDISTIQEGAFSTNTKLVELNLADNKLTEIKQGLFHNLTSLITLTLRNNSIRLFEDGAFTGMNSLQTLKLTKNPFTSLPVGMFDTLGSLKAIYFDHFSLCGYAPHVRLCMPKSDGISTAENLLGNHLLRFAVWFVALLASLGNAFVLLARCFVTEDKKTHSFFIMNLAVADLLMGLYLLIIGIHDVIFREAYILHDLAWRTSSVCKLSGFLSLLSSEVSIMTLTVITMDRFLSIVHPFRFKNRSLFHARLLMVLLWLLGIGLAALPLFHITYFGEFYYGGNGVCLPLQIDQPFSDGWQFSLVIFVVFNLVAFTFISYAYLMMFVTIRRSNLAMRSTKKNQDWALVKRFTLIVATDFVCWMPIILVKFVALGGVSISQSVYAWFAIFVLPINSALNPILYTMTTVLFKQKVLAPLGIVKAQRKKGYITGISVDETSSMSKNSGTRLSIISTKSRGGSMNGRFSSHKKLKNLESQDSQDESVNGNVSQVYSKRQRVAKADYQELPTSDQECTPNPVHRDVEDDIFLE